MQNSSQVLKSFKSKF